MKRRFSVGLRIASGEFKPLGFYIKVITVEAESHSQAYAKANEGFLNRTVLYTREIGR